MLENINRAYYFRLINSFAVRAAMELEQLSGEPREKFFTGPHCVEFSDHLFRLLKNDKRFEDVKILQYKQKNGIHRFLYLKIKGIEFMADPTWQQNVPINPKHKVLILERRNFKKNFGRLKIPFDMYSGAEIVIDNGYPEVFDKEFRF